MAGFWSFSFAKSVSTLAPGTGSLATTRPVGPLQPLRHQSALVHSPQRQRVLDDDVLDTGLAETAAEFRHALHVQSGEVRVVHRARGSELVLQLADEFCLFRFLHGCVAPYRYGVVSMVTPGPMELEIATLRTYTPFAATAWTRTIVSIKAAKLRLQRIGREGDLADGGVHIATLVDAELDLAALRFTHRLAYVERDRAGLRVRHQAARTKHAAQLADLAHLVRRRDHDVEVQPAFLDLRQELGADEIGARFLGFLNLRTGGDDEHAHRLTRSLGQNDGSTHDLIGMTRIDAQTDGHFDGLIELREAMSFTSVDRLARLMRGADLAALRRGRVLLAVGAHQSLP